MHMPAAARVITATPPPSSGTTASSWTARIKGISRTAQLKAGNAIWSKVPCQVPHLLQVVAHLASLATTTSQLLLWCPKFCVCREWCVLLTIKWSRRPQIRKVIQTVVEDRGTKTGNKLQGLMLCTVASKIPPRSGTIASPSTVWKEEFDWLKTQNF